MLKLPAVVGGFGLIVVGIWDIIARSNCAGLVLVIFGAVLLLLGLFFFKLDFGSVVSSRDQQSGPPERPPDADKAVRTGKGDGQTTSE